MTVESATLRVRPLVMTVGMNIVGLVPVMIDTGVGSDVAKRVAAPLWGGLISITVLTLAVIPRSTSSGGGISSAVGPLTRPPPDRPTVTEGSIPAGDP